jgi:3-hydroxyisobutyrate dehydrogenase
LKVGFIGLGAIGFPIAEHIAVKTGALQFFARKESVITRAIGFGGKSVKSIAELGRNIDTAIIFVNTYRQCHECVDGLLQTMQEGGIIVIGSTIAPQEMESIENQCRPKGITAVAAPVTGGLRGAIDATLTAVVSGADGALAECMPLFKCYTAKVIHAGSEIGSAHTLKALIQLLVSINAVAMSEVYSLGVSCGIDPEIIYDTVTNSAGTSRIFENRGKTAINRDFSKRGTIAIINKDLEICNQMAMSAHAPLFLGSVCKQLFSSAARSIDSEEDFSAIIKIYERLTMNAAKELDETKRRCT